MIKRIVRNFFALIVVAAPLVAGCAGMKDYDPEAGTDTDIAADVQQRLRDDSVTAGQVIAVQCDQGIVTLSAVIYNEAVRARALGIARGTPGVKSVVDNTTR